MQDKGKMAWHKKHDWIGNCTLEEITAPLPLPAIPPPSVFGLSPAEYLQNIFDWIAERDGNDHAPGYYEKEFSKYGEPQVFPQKENGKGSASSKGKGVAMHVNLSEDSA